MTASKQRIWMCTISKMPVAPPCLRLSLVSLLAILLQLATLTATDCTIVAPILHHVFFDSSDCTIPERYVHLAGSHVSTYTLDSTKVKADYEVYRDVLNIVGYRLSRNRNWRVALAPVSHGEVISKSIMKCRSEAIRSYLVDVWKVDSGQISVQWAYPDAIRYNPRKDCGNRANWRVDLIPSNDSLLHPVTMTVNQGMTSGVVLEASLLPWNPDSDKPLHSLRYVFDVLRVHAAKALNGRCVIHGDSAQRRFSHWYYLDSKRARKYKYQLGVDTVDIDWQHSRHNGCSHHYPEECLYKRAMHVEYRPK